MLRETGIRVYWRRVFYTLIKWTIWIIILMDHQTGVRILMFWIWLIFYTYSSIRSRRTYVPAAYLILGLNPTDYPRAFRFMYREKWAEILLVHLLFLFLLTGYLMSLVCIKYTHFLHKP